MLSMDHCLLSLVFLSILTGGCLARVVTVSPGPLIRVEGQPVSIRCDVSEYMGPREQDFEWEMSRDAKSQRKKIISTFDSGYSHASLSKRVASGDISVVRLKDNEVELKIVEVKSGDAGFFYCQTPSTDSVISGNYEAQVQLIVIPNTLKVSPQTPPSVIQEESDITLCCNVTRELSQPTYLSVTWSLKKGATSENVLTFGPDGGVVTGQKYTQRYTDGDIQLVPWTNGVFQLVISRLTTSDEGTYECIGAEWTLEKGRKWIKIVESMKEMGPVAVSPSDSSDYADCSALSYIMLVLRVAELVLITVVTVLLFRARAGNQRAPDDHTVSYSVRSRTARRSGPAASQEVNDEDDEYDDCVVNDGN